MKSVQSASQKPSRAETKSWHDLPAAIALTITTLIFSACGEKPQQPPVPKTSPAKPEPAKLFQQERTVLEKSKGVDQTTEKSSEELRQEVERQAQ